MVEFFASRGFDASVFVPWLDRLEAEALASDLPQGWMELFLRCREENHPEVRKVPSSAHDFRKLGFTPSRSSDLFRCFPSDPVFQQSAVRWAEFVLATEARRASSKLAEALVLRDGLSATVFRMTSGCGANVAALVVDEDVLRSGGTETIESMVKPFCESLQIEGNEQRWYHATSWGCAESVMDDGINLGNGERGMDFTSGDAFYLQPQLGAACERCAKRCVDTNVPAAILVYRLNIIDEPRNKVLVGEEWRKVVEACRREKPQRVPHTLHRYASLQGAQCGNPTEVMEGRPPRVREVEGRIVTQLAVWDRAFAKEMGSHLVGAIFFYRRKAKAI